MTRSAIIYARVSTVGQADEELPIESQLESCRRKIAELDALVLREFVDAGISGRTDDRPAFREAISFCRLHHVDYFVCWSTSRFARNRIDAPWHKVQLQKHGTRIVYCSMNLDNSTKEGWMLEGMLELVDEYYSRQVADDTTRSMMKNAREGYYNGGRVPFGYAAVQDGRRKRLQPVESEAALVREICQRYIGGSGTKAIAMYFNRRGVARRGEPWSKANVTLVLRNWVYAGYVVFNRRGHDRATRPETEWIKVKSHAAIIEEALFMRIQRTLDGRSSGPGRGSAQSQHLFTGMLKCGRCGGAMQIETATGRSSRYSYYNCAASIKGVRCRSRRIPAGGFDAWLLPVIIDRIMSIDNLRTVAAEVHREAGDAVKARATRRADLVAQLRDVERRRRRLYELMEAGSPAGLNLADVKPRLMELNGQARAIETSLTEIEFAPIAEVHVSDVDLVAVQEFIRDVVGSANPIKVREFLASFIDGVVVLDAVAEIRYRKDRLVAASATEAVHSANGWLPEHFALRTGLLVAELPDRFQRAA